MTREQLETELARLRVEADGIDRAYAHGKATMRDIRKSEDAMARVLVKLATLD